MVVRPGFVSFLSLIWHNLQFLPPAPTTHVLSLHLVGQVVQINFRVFHTQWIYWLYFSHLHANDFTSCQTAYTVWLLLSTVLSLRATPCTFSSPHCTVGLSAQSRGLLLARCAAISADRQSVGEVEASSRELGGDCLVCSLES